MKAHWPNGKQCEVCSKIFPVKGNPNACKVKTCSPACEGVLHSRNAIKQDYAHTNLTNRNKGWKKTFEKAQTAPSLACGEKHWRSVSATLIEPDGTRHDVVNIANFVRENEGLFNEEDVVWVPARRISKVKELGCRPSHAKGSLACRAQRGLYAVVRGYRSSWKGWKSE